MIPSYRWKISPRFIVEDMTIFIVSYVLDEIFSSIDANLVCDDINI